MLDIKFIRENPDLVKKSVKDKGISLDIDALLKIDNEKRDLSVKVQSLREDRNRAAKKKNIEKGKKVKEELWPLEDKLKEISEKLNSLMIITPNIPAEDTPIGENSKANKEIKKWGEVPKFNFPIKDHIQLGKDLDIIDLETGTKTSGFRGYYLKNEGALLHWGVLDFAFKKIISHGFIPMIPPTLLHEFALIGSGHFPFGKQDVYQIANPGKIESGEEIKNPIFLAGTSEPSLLAYYSEKTINNKNLPIKICAMTQCYRSEVGDYGKDVRGLYRVHEFTKVEQVVITINDIKESQKMFEEMQSISEEILQELELPYHVVQNSTGDMGAGKYKMYDIETWMPSRNSYGETHSNSNLTDWQARRLNIKFKDEKGQLNFCHTLNNTVLASPRILIAILENYQQEDGSVLIPKVLQEYIKKSVIKQQK